MCLPDLVSRESGSRCPTGDLGLPPMQQFASRCQSPAYRSKDAREWGKEALEDGVSFSPYYRRLGLACTACRPERSWQKLKQEELVKFGS